MHAWCPTRVSCAGARRIARSTLSWTSSSPCGGNSVLGTRARLSPSTSTCSLTWARGRGAQVAVKDWAWREPVPTRWRARCYSSAGRFSTSQASRDWSVTTKRSSTSAALCCSARSTPACASCPRTACACASRVRPWPPVARRLARRKSTVLRLPTPPQQAHAPPLALRTHLAAGRWKRRRSWTFASPCAWATAPARSPHWTGLWPSGPPSPPAARLSK
mmetsp:Transcript_9022/g.26183  ORF Transcript_9022/g.26183 Transcript_9022/m.26183 type:complete len:219 (-) Transcript_9022:240-896(-)